MRHYVFSCSNQCQDSIQLAKETMNLLDMRWMLEHDCILQSYHSTFKLIEDEFNTEIYLENEKPYRLIDDCMEFATVLERLKQNSKNI